MSYKSKIKCILKFCLAGFGIAMVIIVTFGIWVYTLRFSGPDAMEMSDYHPFRSPEAKIEYLRIYDERATLWPVASETRIVETSYGQTFVRISGRPDAPPLVLLPGAGAIPCYGRQTSQAYQSTIELMQSMTFMVMAEVCPREP